MRVEVAALCKLPNFQKEAENTTTINIRELKNPGNEPNEVLAFNEDSEEIKEASRAGDTEPATFAPGSTSGDCLIEKSQEMSLSESGTV